MLEGKLNQVATYWAPGKKDPFGGKEWGVPQRIMVRWQDKQKLIRNKEGKEIVSETEIYMRKNINTEGRIARGDYRVSNPAEVSGSREPQAKAEMVGIDGEVVGWKVWL